MGDSGGNWVARTAQSEHIGPSSSGDNIDAKKVANYGWDGANWQRQGYGGTPLTTQIDQSGTTTYVGETQPGNATSEASWRITKIDTSANPIKVQYAGSGLYNQIYDNRASLTYN
jgi:hypothetical protein